MKPWVVAATQLAVPQADVEASLRVHAEIIAETAAAGCDLVVFPELSVTGHNAGIDAIRLAEPLDGPIFEVVRDLATRHGMLVSYGFCERFRGTHYNSSVIVGPDGLLGVHRKVHASFDEFLRFRQAYEWKVWDVGPATVGTAICHDSDFFETWRILALLGADVILLPHADRKRFGADGRLTFDGAGRRVGRRQLLRAQRELLRPTSDLPRFQAVAARDNGVFAVYSSHVGFDGHSTHVGGAYVLGPDGRTLGQTLPGVETAWVKAHLDPSQLAVVRENPAFALRTRRPETYGELVARL